MAEDIRIRVLPKVEKGDSASELSKIISDLEQNAKKIKVGLDDKELLSQIAKLKEQINSLSKGTNIKGNSQLFQGETKSAKELISEYKKLISQKSKLETQMSKQTYRGQAYKSLAKDLTNVNNQIKKVGSQIDGLNKKNIKSDITSSLANSFESTIKKVTELGTALENALGKRNLTGTQVADLKNLQKQIENFKSSANLENILKADKPYAEMSKLMTKASELTQAFRKVELSDALAKSIRKAESDASILQNKIKSLYTKGYGNTNAIDKLFEKAKNLQKINIRVNSKDAESSLVKFTNDIKKLESEYDKLNSKMNQQKKADVLKINVSAAISNLEKMRTKLVETGQDTSKLDGLKTRLQGLNSLTFAEATKEFSKIKKEINDISSEIPKASSAMSRFNKLMSERASLEKQMSKTTNTQSYDVLNKKLQENLSNIKKVSAELDTIKGKNINPDITRSLASTFETLQNQATKTSQTIDNMFKNKNLTGGQIKQLEALKKELDRIKGTKLDNILNISNSHEHMATLLGDLQKVKNTAKEISINGDFNTKIESAYTKIQQLGQQIEKLKNVKGFLNTEDLQSRLQQVIALFNSDLKNAKVNIDSKTATQDFRNLSEVIQLVESELKELTAISENSKNSFDFTTKVNSSLERINTLIKALESMGKETSNAEKIKNELSNLSNLPLEEAESKLKRINQAIDSMSKNTTGIKTQADALREYNKLMDQKTSLEKTLSKTDVKSQSYQLLNSELEKVNSKIEATISLMSNVKLPEGNLKSLTNYSKEFSNVEKSISSLETKLSNVMNKGDKTSSQISRIQEVKNAIDKLKSVSLENILKMDKPYEQVSLLLSEIQKLDKELNSIGENITFSEKLGSQATQAKNQLQQLQTQVETFKKTKFFGDTQSIDSLIQKIKTLSGTKIDLNSEMAEEDVKRLVTNLNELQKEFDELKTKSNIDIKGFNLDTSIQTAMQKLNELEAKFRSIGKDVTPIRNLKNELQGLGKVSFKEAEAQLRKINAETAKLEREFRKATTASKNAASGISSSMKSTSKFVSNLYSTLSTYSLGNILGMQITKGIYAINDTIIELDSAFRDLEKVAPASFTGTKEELEEVKQMAYATGQEVARSSVDIINSTASAFQLGIDNLKDAMEYAKNVNMYANVTGIDEETADKYIKSIASAYGGVSKSLQPMTNKVKGASNAYSMLADYMDQANYAGECKLIAQ